MNRTQTGATSFVPQDHITLFRGNDSFQVHTSATQIASIIHTNLFTYHFVKLTTLKFSQTPIVHFSSFYHIIAALQVHLRFLAVPGDVEKKNVWHIMLLHLFVHRHETIILI
jgi:hypothetical protein